MTIYEVPNIEHCTVSAIGTVGFRVTAHDGWYIHQQEYEPGVDENGNPTKIYMTVALLRADYDFSMLEICAEADLPDNAEICGGDNEPDHEVM